jgi:hypothetical protein
MAMHGVFRALDILPRAVDRAAVPDVVDVAISGDLVQEARVSLRAVCGLIEQHIVLNDVSVGWRTFSVDGRRVRATSLSAERLARSIALGGPAREGDERGLSRGECREERFPSAT